MKTYLFGLPGAAIIALAAQLLLGRTVSGQTAAEYLEKGIYTEETKGDLEGALALYRQAIKESKTTETSAAQALYRIGLIHLKRGDTEKGTQALEELISKYPDQDDLVSAAKKKLPGALELLPIPWADGEQMILHMKFPAGLKIGMIAYHATLGTFRDRPAWIVGGRTFAGVNARSVVHADPETFRPYHSAWKHLVIGEAEGEFSERSVEVRSVTMDTTKEVEIKKPVYDNEQVIHLIRRLPLALGYKTTFDIITTLGGGTILPLGIEVTKEEEITTPAGTFKCAKVEMSVKQTFWFSMDEKRYLVKMDAGGVVGELVEVRHSPPGTVKLFEAEKLGFSLTAPHDWYFYDGGSGDEKDRTRIAILDPEANGQTMLFAFPVNSLAPEKRESLKAWAESRIKEAKTETADYRVRDESWQGLKLGGFPALAWTADGTDNFNKSMKVNYNLVSFAGTTALHFFFITDPDKLEGFKSEFDQIIASYLPR